MELHHLYFFILLLSLAFAASHTATLSPEIYWKVQLPNTPMPRPIKVALHNSAVTPGDLYKLRQSLEVCSKYQHVAEGDLHNLRQPWGVGSWYKMEAEGDLHKLRQPWGLGNWVKSADVGDLHKLRQHLITPYFFETDLHQGKKLNLLSLKNYNSAPIFPRTVADSIPFSTDKIDEILNQFSINKDSEGANMIKKTIKMCEDPAGNGEEKYCATSLESMADFTLSYLGTNKILAISTEVEKETPEVQIYTIKEVKEKANGKSLTCHKVVYPYAIHFCHDLGSTRTFIVSMVGADGTKVNAVSVCHEDTASMNPKALPFQLLNVKPGDKPICHFTLDDQIALVLSQDAMQVAKI